MSAAIKVHLKQALNRQRCCVLSDEQKKYLSKFVTNYKRKQHNLQEEQRRNLVNLQGYEKTCAEGVINARRDLLNQLDELIRSLKPTSLNTKQTNLLIWLLDQEDAANTDSDGACLGQGPALGAPNPDQEGPALGAPNPDQESPALGAPNPVQEGPALGGPVNRLTKFLGNCCSCTCCK